MPSAHENLCYHKMFLSMQLATSFADTVYVIMFFTTSERTHFASVVTELSKVEKNGMGRACGAYGGGERCAQGFGGEA